MSVQPTGKGIGGPAVASLEGATITCPAYPGSCHDPASSYRTLGLLPQKYNPEKVLREFADRPDGTEEFYKADLLRAHIRNRLAGIRIEDYFNRISQNVDLPGRSLGRAAIVTAAMFYELEHLPGHMNYFERHQGTWSARGLNPKQLVFAAFNFLDIAHAGTQVRRAYGKAPERLRAYLDRIPFKDLEAASRTGNRPQRGVSTLTYLHQRAALELGQDKPHAEDFLLTSYLFNSLLRGLMNIDESLRDFSIELRGPGVSKPAVIVDRYVELLLQSANPRAAGVVHGLVDAIARDLHNDELREFALMLVEETKTLREKFLEKHSLG